MSARRVLVVDDDPGMVETLCDILALHGWDAKPAHDGESAVAAVREDAFDAVIMDVRMPRMNGVEALRLIKRERPATRVILITAFAAGELLAEAEREGALRVLPKPVDVPELLAILDEAVEPAQPVLIVDYDESFLDTLADALAARHVPVRRARGLEDALESLGRDPPRAVLLHLRIEPAESQEFMLAIKQVTPSALLLLYSGRPSELARAVAATPPGLVDAVFTKPLPLDRVLQLLRAL